MWATCITTGGFKLFVFSIRFHNMSKNFRYCKYTNWFCKKQIFFRFFFQQALLSKTVPNFCGDGKSWTSVWALWEPRSTVRLHRHRHFEQRIGIEPTSSAWQADILTVVLTLHFYHSQPDHFFNKDLTSLVIGTLLSFLCLSLLAFFLDECLLWASVFIQGSGSSPYESPIF